jgi:hypothetical protein
MFDASSIKGEGGGGEKALAIALLSKKSNRVTNRGSARILNEGKRESVAIEATI